MKVVFIAGPYTGDGTFESIDRNICEAEKYQVALTNNNIGYFCPHNHTSHLSMKGALAHDDFYYALDLHFLQNIADAVLVIPGWENSIGTKREIAWARKQDLPIFFPKNPRDIEEIIVWYKRVNKNKNELETV